MYGTPLVLTSGAASTAHSLQTPVTMALTVGSALNFVT